MLVTCRLGEAPATSSHNLVSQSRFDGPVPDISSSFNPFRVQTDQGQGAIAFIREPPSSLETDTRLFSSIRTSAALSESTATRPLSRLYHSAVRNVEKSKHSHALPLLLQLQAPGAIMRTHHEEHFNLPSNGTFHCIGNYVEVATPFRSRLRSVSSPVP